MTKEEILKIAKPIFFNTEMVRAILDGRKSVTRRIWKDWNRYAVPDMSMYDADKRTYAVHTFEDPEHTKKTSIIERRCPICPGDILYVRETWQHLYELDGNEQIIEGTGKYYYAATDTLPFDTYVDSMGITHNRVPWHPSIHMPKEAARIFLRVTDVRVERLQEIDAIGCLQEGIESEYPHVLNGVEKRYAFSQLWNSTIKKSELDIYGWDADAYVWVIEFERIEV